MARLRRFFAEAPIFFIAVVVGIALTFKVAIGWAKSASPDETAKDPTVSTSTAAAGSTSTTPTATPAGKTATPALTPEPRPAATATVPSTPRKKPRPRH